MRARDDDWTRTPVRRISAALLATLAIAGAAWSSQRTPMPAAHGGRPPGRVDLNAATAAELTLLPTIGPTRARSIVDDRRDHGPFASIDDLDRVHGIGPRTIARIAPFAEAGGRTLPSE